MRTKLYSILCLFLFLATEVVNAALPPLEIDASDNEVCAGELNLSYLEVETLLNVQDIEKIYYQIYPLDISLPYTSKTEISASGLKTTLHDGDLMVWYMINSKSRLDSVWQYVRVVDKIAPVVDCERLIPDVIVKDAEIASGICVDLDYLKKKGLFTSENKPSDNRYIFDNCTDFEDVKVTSKRSDGMNIDEFNADFDAPFMVGVTSVIWTFIDKNGNSSFCPQCVVVPYNALNIRTTPIIVEIPVSESDCSVAYKIAPMMNVADLRSDILVEREIIDTTGKILTNATQEEVDSMLTHSDCGNPLMLDFIVDSLVVMNDDSIYTFHPHDRVNTFYVVYDSLGNSDTCLVMYVAVDKNAPKIADLDTVRLFYKENECMCGYGLTYEEINTLLNIKDCENTTISYSIDGVTTVLAPGENIDVVLHDKDIKNIVWTVTDESNNSSSTPQIVVAYDTIAPKFDCSTLKPVLIVVLREHGDEATFEKFEKVGLDTSIYMMDNCDGKLKPSFYRGDDKNVFKDIYPSKDTTILFTSFTDKAGNYSYCEQNLIVLDSIKPQIVCPHDYGKPFACIDDVKDKIYMPKNFSEFKQYLFGSVLDEQNMIPEKLTVSDDTAGNSCESVITRTYTIYDIFGGSSSCSNKIYVKDTIAPVWTKGFESGLMTDTMFLSCEASPSGWSIPKAMDSCNDYTVNSTSFKNQGTDNTKCDYYNYEKTFIYTATDVCGNTNPDTFRMVLAYRDSTAPSFDVPEWFDTDYVYAVTNGNGDLAIPDLERFALNRFDLCSSKSALTYSQYPAPGTSVKDNFTAQMIMTDACGNKYVYEKEISIAIPPIFLAGDTIYCINDENVKSFDSLLYCGDTLGWNFQLFDEIGNQLDLSTKPDVSKSGKTYYRANLVNKNTGMESGNIEFSVTVLGVETPSIISLESYCQYSGNVELEYINSNIGNEYTDISRVEWFINGNPISGNPVINTEDFGMTEVTLIAYNGECQREPIMKTISVIESPVVLGELSISYSMDDAIDGIYPSLLEQNPNVVDMDFLYDADVFWFDENFMQLPAVPTPIHHESWNDGNPHTTYYIIEAINRYGCIHEELITVTFNPSDKDNDLLDCEKPEGKWKDFVLSRPVSYYEIGDSVIINDVNAFVWFMSECNGSSTGMEGKIIKLNHDIDLCGRFWSPIKNFSGIFDGQGHSVSGLRTVREDYVSNSGALFAKNSGIIENLHLKNTQIKDSIITSTLYSSLVGLNTGIVKKCSNNGIIDVRTDKNRGTTKTGGLVAENQGTVEDCKSYGAIYVKYASGFTENMTGGIVGYNNKGLVNACINEAKVVANGMSVGGVVGTTNYKVYNCANRNTILGKTYFGSGEGALYLGGVVGVLGKSEAILENSYNIAYTDGNSLVGEADGQTMVNCYKINSKPSLQDTYNFSYTYYLTDSVPTPTPYQGNYGFSKDSEGSFILEKESWGTTDLVEALNAWVDNQKDSVFMHWSYDTLNINSGYPCLTLDYDIIECLPFDSVGLYTRDEIVCKESPFHVKISGGDINRWYVNDSFLIDADECDITISSNMNYSVLTVEVSVGTCNYIINDTIHFESLVPFVMKGWDDVIAISNADSIFTSYQWYRDGVELHGETDQYFYESGGLSSGSYQTVVLKTDGSSQKSCPVVVKNDMSTRGTSPYIDVYPNPARENDVFIVSMQNVHISDVESLQIADNRGIIVWHRKNISNSQEISLSQGVYVVYAKMNSGKIISNKIVVAK